MSKVKNWLQERVPTGGLNYKVPRHANTLAFTLGGITLVSIIILIITGILLAQFYTPTPDQANESIRVFLNEYQLGNFIRGLHYWAAQVAIVTVILHLLRVFFYGSYKKPREVNWLLGVLLFVGMAGLYYTGTILKWDQEAFEALEHAQAAAGMFGGFIAEYFSDTPVVPLLSKVFSLHTSVLPIFLLALIPGHLLLVKALGISPLPWKKPKEKQTIEHIEHEEGTSTFMVHMKHLAGYGLILFGLIAIFAAFLPPSLGHEPVSGIEATKPPWIFMSIFTIENWFGLSGLVVTSILLVLALFTVPFVDRKGTQAFKERKVIVGIGALTVILAIAFTVNAYVTKPKQHIGMGSESKQEVVDDGHTQEEESQNDKGTQSAEIKVLNQALVITDELIEAVKAKNLDIVVEKAEALDEAVDGIGDQIKAKDSDLRNEIGEAIHHLAEIKEEKTINVEHTVEDLEGIKSNLNKAQGLFK